MFEKSRCDCEKVFNQPPKEFASFVLASKACRVMFVSQKRKIFENGTCVPTPEKYACVFCEHHSLRVRSNARWLFNEFQPNFLVINWNVFLYIWPWVPAVDKRE